MSKRHSYNRHVLELHVFPNNISQFLLRRSVFVVQRDRSTVSDEQKEKETARSLILSGIEIHASITDYFHGLASFGTDSRKCFAGTAEQGGAGRAHAPQYLKNYTELVRKSVLCPPPISKLLRGPCFARMNDFV